MSIIGNDIFRPVNVELDDSNYIFWSDNMETYLPGRGLWEYTGGSNSKPDYTDASKLKERDMNNYKIIS